MKGFRIPFLANIPIEQEREINDKVNIEMIYEREKDKRIQRHFNNPTSNLKKVADYLWTRINQEISYEEISEALGISEGSIRIYVSELNYFKGFPLTMIPIPKKKGYIQSVLNNEEDYQKWDKKKMMTITSMSVIKNKAEKITSSKKKARKQQTEKNKEKEIIIGGEK
jgi:DNA-directed RNA polymerase specialized sigma subunit